MSEFIRCNNCGDLSSYENTNYINYQPICPECHEKLSYSLQTVDNSND